MTGSPLTLGFFHGWGFDATLWNGVIAHLPGYRCLADERGYFGEPRTVPACTIAVAHSLGTMRVLAEPTAGCEAIVAINGFDRFAAAPGFPGVAPRVVERMEARLADSPAAVLNQFRARCGSPAAAPPLTPAGQDRLAQDLALLRTGDLRARPRPALIALHAADDPIVPVPMQHAVLTGSQVERADRGGHLLPLTDPARCAAVIVTLVQSLHAGTRA